MSFSNAPEQAKRQNCGDVAENSWQTKVFYYALPLNWIHFLERVCGAKKKVLFYSEHQAFATLFVERKIRTFQNEIS